MHPKAASATMVTADGSGTACKLSTMNELDTCAPMFDGTTE
jgi:hypothetical protein